MYLLMVVMYVLINGGHVMYLLMVLRVLIWVGNYMRDFNHSNVLVFILTLPFALQYKECAESLQLSLGVNALQVNQALCVYVCVCVCVL